MDITVLRAPGDVERHTDRGSHRGARQIHNRLTRFSSHLISHFLSSSSATLRRHSRIPSATRSSAISSGRQSLLGSHGEPLSGGALGAPRHDVRGERQEGLPSHPPKRTNGADRRSDHSGTTQQGAQQPPATENLRETNVELREENPKTSPENLINTFCGAP